MGLFQKAVKTQAKLRMAITGPSGSGKTYTALAIGTELANGGRVAVVDTEHGSASKYADIFDFDVAEMHAPFAPTKYVATIVEAAEAGYDVVILDSLSHAWSGTGGVIDIVDEAAKRMKNPNSFAAWKEGTPEHNKLIDAIVQANIHVIGTMRAKTEYVIDDRNRPRKVGMAPVQRDQFEYEFDVVLDMDIENNGIVSKTRCPALASGVFPKPGADVAGILSEWLQGDKPQINMDTVKPVDPDPKPATKQPAATNGNGHKPAENPQPKASGAIAEDGWDELWNSQADYPAAKQWAWQSGKFAVEKHLDNAWAKVFKTNAGHKPENVELFLQGWRTYVNAHEPVEAEAEQVPA